MTIGIYAIYWLNEGLVYVGQSQNIEQRIYTHLASLKNNKHNNKKLQNAYNKYGVPEHLTLEETNISDITNAEILWVSEFNSIKEGLNILDPARSLYGTSSGKSKYSKNTVLKVFSMLYKTTVAYSFISERLSVPYTLIRDIKTKVSHVWLQQEYPEKYEIMIQRKQNTSKRRDRLMRS